MSDKDVLEAIETLLSAYPRYDPPNKKSMRDLWLREFSRLDGAVLKKAVELHYKSSKWFPGIHEIRDQLTQAEYMVGNQQAGVSLSDLRVRAKELENQYYIEGVFDRDAWMTLVRTYHKLGHEANADSTRRRMEALQNGRHVTA
jgi:hypothetical protein